MRKRKAITPRMKVDALLHRVFIQFGVHLRCPISRLAMKPGDPIEFDHIHCVELDGPHTYSNLRPVLASAHQKKTKADLRMIKKTRPGHTEGFVVVKPMDHADEALMNIKGAKQYKRKFPKGRKMQSRGFEKRRAS